MNDTDTGAKGRRRRFLINPRLQLTMIGFNVGLAFVAILILYLENMYVFSRFFGTEFPELQNDPIIMSMIQEDQFRLKVAFGLTALVFLLIMTVGGLILSNRVAGPIYRLDKHMRDFLSGRTQGKINFRKKDFFVEIVESYNEILDRVKK